MRKARVFFKEEEAGILTQHDDRSFSFCYHDGWIADSRKQSISLTLPKTAKEFHSNHLFPFFYNILPEGSNKDVMCKLNRIDREDYFGLLITSAKNDSIGAVRIIKFVNE